MPPPPNQKQKKSLPGNPPVPRPSHARANLTRTARAFACWGAAPIGPAPGLTGCSGGDGSSSSFGGGGAGAWGSFWLGARGSEAAGGLGVFWGRGGFGPASSFPANPADTI